MDAATLAVQPDHALRLQGILRNQVQDGHPPGDAICFWREKDLKNAEKAYSTAKENEAKEKAKGKK